MFIVAGGQDPQLTNVGGALKVGLGALIGDIDVKDTLMASEVGLLLYVLQLLMVTIVFVNVLIAILNKSYSEIVQEAGQAFLMLQANLTHAFYLKVGEQRLYDGAVHRFGEQEPRSLWFHLQS